MKVFWLLSFSK